ncbi:HTH domain-containing protein [Haloarcula nitratireducens]|uniref:Uncharacterized protein n=1 Tax=Haloarcula nitratireducens TaxID=2487749 RepID=A0AAW4P8S2_9EURY|nr:HTH domain-containing protein [Halomicroarcula nitratireducens]MBX0294157.1 hypothetical protein [Halomicroarcula nitratireducens]
MPKTECPTTRRAELFVRSDLPQPSRKRRAAIEERLCQLQRRGVFDGFETTTWRKRVPVEGDDARPERDRYNEFAEWASETDACLAPFFDTRLCYSTETGEKRTELVMPVLCLAIYEDGKLAQVAPVGADGKTRSVDAFLTELADTGTRTAADGATVTTAN